MNLEEVVSGLIEKVEKRYFGKYRGIVESNEDPKKIGRLKVRVPGLLSENIVTGWALPCFPYGGNAGQGMVFIPEKGAGVWVEFEEGDLEFPVWVGVFYSRPDGESELPKAVDKDGVDTGEAAEAGVVSRKIIRTKSGHTIQFEDDADASKSMLIIREGNKKHRILFDDNGITIFYNEKNYSIVLKDAGIDILAENGEINIKGKNINITAAGDLTAKGKLIHLNP